MRGRHSIGRRWGRYQEQDIEEMSFFICIKLSFWETKNVILSMMQSYIKEKNGQRAPLEYTRGARFRKRRNGVF
jgi:hypothetical protein